MKIYIFIVLIFNFFYSQHGHHHGGGHDHGHSHASGSIVGTVINANTGNPIEYASVSLINQQSNQVEVGQLTLLDGRFILSDFHKGNYKVSITFMGFETWESEVINITDHSIKKDLGTISLKIKSIQFVN